MPSPHEAREAIVRLEGDIRNLDPAVHGDDLTAATEHSLDDLNIVLTTLEALWARVTELELLVERIRASAERGLGGP
jgi:hypothetical protein